MKIFIGTPSVNRLVGVETCATLFAIARDLTSRGHETEYLVAPSTWIDGARNDLCDKAIAWGADYIIMIDDDMSIPSEAIHSMIENNVDICAPIMHRRRAPFASCNFILKKESDTYITITEFKRKLVECDAVGAGIIVIRASILSKILRPWFKSGQINTNTEKLGEDVYFCKNAKRSGFKVYYDGRFQATHYGDPLPVKTDWLLQIPCSPFKLED